MLSANQIAELLKQLYIKNNGQSVSSYACFLDT